MNKLNAILEDARTNAIELYNLADEKGEDFLVKNIYEKEISTLEKHIDNSMPLTMDSLRHHLKDKSEGDMYHAWMCNIKFAIYDSIMAEYDWADDEMRNMLATTCEDGAKLFLDRLLKEDDDKAKG